MGRPKINLINERFGKLIVRSLGEQRGPKGLTIWNCLCDCGNECSVRSDLLTSGKTKSCGCLRKLPEGVGSFNSLLLRYKRQAADRGYSFELDEKQFLDLVKKNCYYCGIEPQQEQKAKGSNGKFIYNGIDRLDNDLGYTTDNVVACCKSCNRAKDRMNFEQFKKVIKRTYINLYRKVSDKTPGELIDALITVDIKCYIFQEKQVDENLSDSERVQICQTILELNKKRNRLMRSIDVLFDFTEDMVTPKTYLPNSKDDFKSEF